MNLFKKVCVFLIFFAIVASFAVSPVQANLLFKTNKTGQGFNQNPVCKTSIKGEGRVKAKVCISEVNGWIVPSVTFLDPSTCTFTITLNDVTKTEWWVNWGEGKILSSYTYTIPVCKGQYSTKAIGLVNGKSIPAVSGHKYGTYVTFIDYNGDTFEYDPPEMIGHIIGK